MLIWKFLLSLLLKPDLLLQIYLVLIFCLGCFTSFRQAILAAAIGILHLTGLVIILKLQDIFKKHLNFNQMQKHINHIILCVQKNINLNRKMGIEIRQHLQLLLLFIFHGSDLKCMQDREEHCLVYINNYCHEQNICVIDKTFLSLTKFLCR